MHKERTLVILLCYLKYFFVIYWQMEESELRGGREV